MCNEAQKLLDEARQQSLIAVPTLIGQLCNKIPWIISLHFVGILGPEKLAAAALATTLCNVTGMSFNVGLSGAITTLAGQARGHLIREGKQSTKESTCEEKKDEIESNYDFEQAHFTPLVQIKVQNYGSKSNEEEENASELTPLQPVVFLFRGMAIQLAFVIPIGLWWIKGLKPFLVALGQDEKLSGMAESYLRVLAPGLWSNSINWIISSWLQSIEIADVPAFAAFVGFASHIPFNILFIYVLGFDYLGVAIVTVLFQTLQPIIICGYIFFTKPGRDRLFEGLGAKHAGRNHLSFWPEIRSALSSLLGIKQYLSLALPGIVIISEWWASEFIIFLSGRLSPQPDVALGSLSIFQSINTFFFQFPLAVSAASSARVGLFLGLNRPESAKTAACVSAAIAGCMSATCGCLLIFTPHEMFASIFTNDPDVIRMAASTIPFLPCYLLADGMQIILTGVVRGCGRQAILVPVVVFAYWVIAVPMAYYVSFEEYDGTTVCDYRDTTCGVKGLVSATTLGTFVHFIASFFVVTFAIDWGLEARRARDRMSKSR